MRCIICGKGMKPYLSLNNNNPDVPLWRCINTGCLNRRIRVYSDAMQVAQNYASRIHPKAYKDLKYEEVIRLAAEEVPLR